MSFKECVEECKSDSECRSIIFGRDGGNHHNWCILYDVICTNDGDDEYLMFTPESEWMNYNVALRYNGGCAEHFQDRLESDTTGQLSFGDCYFKCKNDTHCFSFAFGRYGVERQNWCHTYSSQICTRTGDTDWDMFTTSLVNKYNSLQICGV